MKRLSFRRRAVALIALGFAFLPLGLRAGGHRAYEGVAVCFWAAGVATLRRGPRRP